jgi:hypothetical protein
MNQEHESNEDESQQPSEDLQQLTEAERERWFLEKWDERPPVFLLGEVAKEIRVSRSTAYVLADNGTLPCKQFGRCKRITRFDLFLLLVRGDEGQAA